MTSNYGLETKFCRLGEDIAVTEGTKIEGYASVFGVADQGGDVVQKGAYQKSLTALEAQGRRVKMLWQHDASQGRCCARYRWRNRTGPTQMPSKRQMPSRCHSKFTWPKCRMSSAQDPLRGS